VLQQLHPAARAIMPLTGTGNNEGFTPIGLFEDIPTLSEDGKNPEATPRNEVMEQIHSELGEVNNNYYPIILS
jgi:hypothetical protein